MTRTLLLVLAALAAAPAFAQPPTAAPQPAASVNAQAAPGETEEEFILRWEREQALYAQRREPILLADVPVLVIDASDIANADTPLPPPCEPPVPRSPPQQPGPPAPAPCPLPR